jgi:hypothetical protein
MATIALAAALARDASDSNGIAEAGAGASASGGTKNAPASNS